MIEKDIKDCNEDELILLTGGEHYGYSQMAQAELTRRLMKSIKALDSSTTKYSKMLIVLTLFLILVAFFQLAAAIFTIEIPYVLQLATLIVAGTFLVFAFYKLIDLVK